MGVEAKNGGRDVQAARFRTERRDQAVVPAMDGVEIPDGHDGPRESPWVVTVPLVLLDSNLPENSAFVRQLTEQLYRSDNAEWRILQRLILGIGGMKSLEALGYRLEMYHLNEGHAALAFIEKAKGKDDSEPKK